MSEIFARAARHASRWGSSGGGRAEMLSAFAEDEVARAFERVTAAQLARYFKVTETCAQQAIDDFGFLYRQPALRAPVGSEGKS